MQHAGPLGKVALFGAGVALALASAEAQAPRRITLVSNSHCESCRIEARRLVTLGGEDDSLVAGAWSSVVRMANGGYLAATILQSGSGFIRQYDASGRLLGRLGRSGSGPGEYRSITHLAIGPGDSILVFDVYRRLSILAPDGRFIRSTPIPFLVTQATIAPDGEYVVAAEVYSTALAGLPVHRLTPDGRRVHSFGAEPAEVSPERPSLSKRLLASAGHDFVWTARPDRYELERWTASGIRTEILTRTAEWFPPRDVEMYPLDHAPTPFVLGLAMERSQRIWVLASRADESWNAHQIARGEGVRFSPADRDRLYDSVLELIDPHAGSVIAALRLPFHAGGFIDDQTLWTLRESESGLWFIDVWTFRLTTSD